MKNLPVAHIDNNTHKRKLAVYERKKSKSVSIYTLPDAPRPFELKFDVLTSESQF